MALVLFKQKVLTLAEAGVGLSLPSRKAPPVMSSLSLEIGFLLLLTLRMASRASTLSFFILLPDSSMQRRLSFFNLFSYPVRQSTSPALMLLYRSSRSFNDLEAATAGTILLKASLVILLFEILSLSNLGLTSIKLLSLSSQSSYWLSPRLLYSMTSCRREELRVSASKISLNPSAEISLLLISSISILRWSAMNLASSLAPSSPMNLSLKTTRAESLKFSNWASNDIFKMLITKQQGRLQRKRVFGAKVDGDQ